MYEVLYDLSICVSMFFLYIESTVLMFQKGLAQTEPIVTAKPPMFLFCNFPWPRLPWNNSTWQKLQTTLIMARSYNISRLKAHKSNKTKNN